MDPHEAIIIKGVRKYADNTGYGSSLNFNELESPIIESFDSMNRLEQHTFIAIDAYIAQQKLSTQLKADLILRDLIKAFVGFRGPTFDQYYERTGLKKRIITGKWGCGVF